MFWKSQEIQVPQKEGTVSGWLFLNQGGGVVQGPTAPWCWDVEVGQHQAFRKKPMWPEQLLKMAG